MGYCPDWSPDGDAILCDSLIMITPEGIRLGKVPYGPGVGFPVHGRWSPDGETIAFGGANYAIWLIEPDGQNPRELVVGSTPSWSPDGREIAYGAVSSDGTYSAIWVVDIDGTGARQVTFAEMYVDSS